MCEERVSQTAFWAVVVPMDIPFLLDGLAQNAIYVVETAESSSPPTAFDQLCGFYVYVAFTRRILKASCCWHRCQKSVRKVEATSFRNHYKQQQKTSHKALMAARLFRSFNHDFNFKNTELLAMSMFSSFNHSI